MPIDLTVDPDWRVNSHCRGKDPDQWDTQLLDRGDLKTDTAAYQNCRPCTQHGNCARVALKMNNYGEGLVWAGVAVPFKSSADRYQRAIKRLERIARVTESARS